EARAKRSAMSKQVIGRSRIARVGAGVLVVVALAVPPAAFAQGVAVAAPAAAQGTGSISGVVNEQTTAASEAVTDGQGAFSVTGLAAGRYRVESSLDGFEAVTSLVVLENG